MTDVAKGHRTNKPLVANSSPLWSVVDELSVESLRQVSQFVRLLSKTTGQLSHWKLLARVHLVDILVSTKSKVIGNKSKIMKVK
jgi:hypothetical protein